MADIKNIVEVAPSEKAGSVHSLPNGQPQLSWGEQMLELKRCRRAVYSALACSSLAILIGYDATLVGSLIANTEFQKSFGKYDAKSNSYSLPANWQLAWTLVSGVGSVIGAFVVGVIGDRFGRRIGFWLTLLLTFIGAAVELVSPNWKIWTVAKLLFGLAVGTMQGSTTTFVSEIAPVSVRGFMLSLFQFWIIFGAFLAACVLEGTSHMTGTWSWKTTVVTQWGLGLTCGLFYFILVPESPYWLISNGHVDRARRSLQIMRGREIDYDIEEDLRIIAETIEHEKEIAQVKVTYLDCFKGSDRRRTLLAIFAMVIQQFSGFALCGNYLTYFLQLSGVKNEFLISVLSYVFGLFAISLSFLAVEKMGRRPQFLGGLFGMIPCLLVIGVLGCFDYTTKANGITLAVFIIIWSILFYISCGSIGWTLVGELSSVRLRAKAGSMAVAAVAISNTAFGIAVPYLINKDSANLGPKAAFVFLGPFTALTILAFFIIPETKGKTFQELDRLFEAGTPARKF